MTAGWRVRRARQRRRERLAQDVAHVSVQASTGSGPGVWRAGTQQACGSVQAVQVGQPPEPLAVKHASTYLGDDAHAGGGECDPSREPFFYLDHLDHLDQASNGAAFDWSNHVTPGGPPGPPTWFGLDAWCARIGGAGQVSARRAVLRAWVAAAGGCCDAKAVYLPIENSNSLALATLRAHAQALGMHVEDHAPDAQVRRLLGAAERAVASPDALADEAELTVRGESLP